MEKPQGEDILPKKEYNGGGNASIFKPFRCIGPAS
jgi:hypothetical protein